MSTPPQQHSEEGSNSKPTGAEQQPAPAPSTKPAHGFQSVPRALLVERVAKDSAKAHKLGDKVMRSMEGQDQQQQQQTEGGGAAGAGGPAAGGGGGGRSALQRALDAAEALEGLSLSSASAGAGDGNNDGDGDGDRELVALRIYKEVVIGAVPLAVAKELSRAERKETKRSETTLIYGEISYPAMAAILDKIRTEYGKPRTVAVEVEGGEKPFEYAGVMQEPGKDVLVDLGSGAGKPVFAAAALHPFKRVVGIEILESLHGAALEILGRWDAEARSRLKEHHGGVDTEIVLLQGDFLSPSLRDWATEADVVVANSTCYDDKLMQRIAEQASRLKQGAIVVTLTRRLPAPAQHFHLLFGEAMQMSWGEATVYIHLKLSPPASTYQPPSHP